MARELLADELRLRCLMDGRAAAEEAAHHRLVVVHRRTPMEALVEEVMLAVQGAAIITATVIHMVADLVVDPMEDITAATSIDRVVTDTHHHQADLWEAKIIDTFLGAEVIV